jgi:hypothetical protein
MARNEEDSFVCHCEERSDVAISKKKVEIAALLEVARNDIVKLYFAMTYNNETWNCETSDREARDREALDHKTWNCKARNRETCGRETGKIDCRLLWLRRET